MLGGLVGRVMGGGYGHEIEVSADCADCELGAYTCGCVGCQFSNPSLGLSLFSLYSQT